MIFIVWQLFFLLIACRHFVPRGLVPAFGVSIIWDRCEWNSLTAGVIDWAGWRQPYRLQKINHDNAFLDPSPHHNRHCRSRWNRRMVSLP